MNILLHNISNKPYYFIDYFSSCNLKLNYFIYNILLIRILYQFNNFVDFFIYYIQISYKNNYMYSIL